MDKKKEMSLLIEKISNINENIDYNKGLEGLKEFPLILSKKFKDFVLNREYISAKKTIDNYFKFSKILKDSFNYFTNKEDKQFNLYKNALEELNLAGYFEENGKNNEKRAYENN